MARRPAAQCLLLAMLTVFTLLTVLTGGVDATGATEVRSGPVPGTSTPTLFSAPAGGPATDSASTGRRRDPHPTLSIAPLVGRGERPNVIVIMTDDARNDDLRFMPHVRRLIGEQGVRFTNAFSPQPLCCPARASFLTGEYSHNHGVWSQAPPYGFQALDDRSTLPVWLQDAGYDTVFLGKYLNRYGAQNLPDGRSSLRYVPPGWTDWRATVDRGGKAGPSLGGGTYRYFDTTLNVNGTLAPHPGEYQTTLFGRISREVIRERARSPRPFFYWASFLAPHHGAPTEADDPRPVLRSDGRKQIFRNPARPQRVRGRFDSVIRQAPGYRGEANVADKPFFLRDVPPLTSAEEAAVRESARQRAEALWLVDRQVARLFDTLRRAGELTNTYVMFTSDNGFFLGEHRMRQGKTLPYEPSLRIPLLVRGPGIPAGEVRTDPFTMIDFAPTVLDAASVRGPGALDGVSLLDVARRGDRGWTRGILTDTGPRAVESDSQESDNFQVEGAEPSPLRFSQGVRTGDYLYVEHASRERELYDLRGDPRQVTNLVRRPDQRSVVRSLAHELDLLRDCAGRACSRPLPPTLRTDSPAPTPADGQPD